MCHLTTDELERYSLNNARPELVGYAEEHLLICERCRVNLSHLEEQISLMRDILAQFADEDATLPSRTVPAYQKPECATAHGYRLHARALTTAC